MGTSGLGGTDRRRSWWRRLWREDRGTVSLEFAVSLPLLLVLTLGLADTVRYLSYDRKASNAARAVADLVGRFPQQITQANFADIETAVDEIMKPYDPALSYIVSHMPFDAGGTPDPTDDDYWNQQEGDLPAEAVSLTQSILDDMTGTGRTGAVIIVVLQYTFDPLFVDYVFGVIDVTKHAVTVPRLSETIDCPSCSTTEPGS